MENGYLWGQNSFSNLKEIEKPDFRNSFTYGQLPNKTIIPKKEQKTQTAAVV